MQAARSDMSSKTVCSKTLRTRAKFAGVALALSSAWLFWTSPASAVMTIVDSEVFRVVLDPRDSNTLYAGTSNGVFKSTDQAESWYAINSGLPRSARAQAVTVDPQDSQTIYVGLDFPGGIFKSANGGDVWEPTGQTGGLDNVLDIVIDSNDPNRVHVAGSGFYSYVRSTDGGRDWSSGRYFATARAMAMDPLDSNTIYLA